MNEPKQQVIKIDSTSFLEVQVLMTERTVLICEMEGMKAENEVRKTFKDAIKYNDICFFEVCEKIQDISDRMKILLEKEKNKGG